MILLIIAAVAVVLIAAGSLVWVSRRLASTERSAVYDIVEATDFVADRLPTALQAKLSHDDVEMLLLWHLEYMRANGHATFGWSDTEAREASVGGEQVVAHENEVVDHVLVRAAESGRDLDEVDVVVVLEHSNDYLDAIGAFGPRRELETDT